MKSIVSLVVVFLTTAMFAQTKELTCTASDHGSTQLILNEPARTVTMFNYTANAVFSDESVKWETENAVNQAFPRVRGNLNRMTGALAVLTYSGHNDNQGNPAFSHGNYQCEVAQKKF